MSADLPLDEPSFSRARIERGANPAADVVLDARKAESQLLRSLADVGQGEVAALAGISEVRLSRWKNSAADGGGLHLSEVAAVLAAMGLTVIDARACDMVTKPRSEWDALRTLARKALES